LILLILFLVIILDNMSEPSAKPEKAQNAVVKSILASPPMFDHERLDVHQLELQFIAWVSDLLEEVPGKPAGKLAEACDQLDRASRSALLNTAAGSGKRQRQGRARSFDDARGPATECAACLDALIARQAVREERILKGRKLLARIVSMRCGLVDRFDVQGQLRDEATGLDLNVSAGPADYGPRKSRTRTMARRKI